ncbi:MAG: Spx/MgsR family RNA polymerase-binding regulatory protein [Alicyclobacillus herbarius]|uniref:arsenate reductase family protein n=1 Tax=Alicyclobacillus herbarius TaxID=122960 RepID=UPI002355637D|nr:Spx/MgsR family RNA polymerase-binding regulatory protein [Alicyclobacillus herbarius]MCL6631560.1 Spx/MgsR family RNA polymerase-binding regulatory protein [Alicyclobacillus herbarius]
MEFYGYRRCSTCRNAYKYLQEHGVEVVFQDLVDKPPTREQIRQWVSRLGQGIDPFLNRRGTRFRELGLKDARLSEDEWIEKLSADGKLFKRPILVTDEDIILGFDRAAYDHVVEKEKANEG